MGRESNPREHAANLQLVDLAAFEKVDLVGAADLHCNCGFPYSTDPVDALAAATDAAAARFRAIVLTSLECPTVLVANVIAAVVPDIAVFGSVACEREIGGINPAAVEAALRAGAKIVLLPTLGVRGEARIGAPGNPAASAPPIAVCDDETGELLYHTHEVMALVAQHDAILATGQISQFESYAVAKAFAGKGRIIVTNATEFLAADQCIELVALGATIEITAATFIGKDATRAPTEAAAFIRAIGTDHVVLSSGLGPGADMQPARGLHHFAEALVTSGVTDSAVRQMACTNPATLLGY